MRQAQAVKRQMHAPPMLVACAVAVVALVASACGSGSSSSSSAPAATTTAAKGPVSMKVATDAGGQQVLVGSTGRTLYSFDPDTKGGQSVCYGKCASAWPPLTVTGKPVLGAGLDQSMVGTITRKDGTKQATYGGWPLYYFAFDKKAGDTNGQGDEQVWWLMTPGGGQIRLPATIQAAANHKYVTDSHGFTLYRYTPDKGSGKSSCTTGKCAQEWPAVTTTGAPVAGSGLTGKLGTTKLPDGREQVTLNGWPLYYFAGDSGPGEHNGQGKFGVWWEVTPAGAAYNKKSGL
jgi:predicted lipoprotein with Yx(FWY)xxD motif